MRMRRELELINGGQAARAVGRVGQREPAHLAATPAAGLREAERERERCSAPVVLLCWPVVLFKVHKVQVLIKL